MDICLSAGKISHCLSTMRTYNLKEIIVIMCEYCVYICVWMGIQLQTDLECSELCR